jgi:hypothetical protein
MRRMLLAAVLLLSAAVPAMAQITEPVTFNVFGRANRQPGTYTTASVVIPEGIYGIGVTDTMTDQDASDPANSFVLWLEISQDGVSWVPWGFREQWQGGTWVNKQGVTVPNHINNTWSNTDLANGVFTGWRVRAVLDQSVAMRVGFNVVAYPPGFSSQLP